MNWDLDNLDCWEYIFFDSVPRIAMEDRGSTLNLDSMKEELHAAQEAARLAAEGGVLREGGGYGEEGDNGDQGAEAAGGVGANFETFANDGQVLDIPPSWVSSKLTISRDEFATRYSGGGARTALFKRSKYEFYAEFKNPVSAGVRGQSISTARLTNALSASPQTGIVSRLTTYEGDLCSIPVAVTEKYSKRRDKLIQRVRNPMEGKLTELFTSGRPSGLRMYVDVSGQRREFHYYLEARHNDGLLKREIQIGKRINEWYKGREDFLTFRSIEFFSGDDDEDEDDIDVNDR